jgi:tetratricopeptide (TPR) repeat protein
MRKIRFGNWNWSVILCLSLALPCALVAAPETKKPASETPAHTDDLSPSNDVIRAYLQLQAKIHDAELEIERTRQESQMAAAKSAEEIATRLQNIEQSVATQRLSEVEAMQSTTRFMLVALSAFAGLGFLAVTLTAYFQWRAITRLAQISSTHTTRPMEKLPILPALSMHDDRVGSPVAADSGGPRLLGVVERLEKRIAELEQTATTPLPGPGETNGHGNATITSLAVETQIASMVDEIANKADKAAEPTRRDHGQLTLLLDRGQLLLDQSEPQQALACFDQVLELDPGNAEALVRKGAALEKLQKVNEAIECYDRAIATDNSMTIAYLHKGGLFNRMERFSEAVECYEQALRTQEKQHA